MTTVVRDASSPSKQFRDWKLSDVSYSLSYSPIVAPSGSASQNTVNDIVYNTITGSTKTNAQVTATATGNLSGGALDGSTMQCLDLGSVSSFDPVSGMLIAASSPAVVRILCKARIPRLIQVPVDVEVETTTTFASFAAGSAALAASTDISNTLAARGANDYQNLANWKPWTQVGLSIHNNTTAWTHPYDLSCVSYINAQSNFQRGATLISPRHVAMAQHFKLTPPCLVYFVGSDNTLYSGNLVGTSDVGTGDISIGIFDADIPSAVTPAKLMPANAWTAHMPGAAGTALNSTGVPVICFNQDKMAFVGSLIALGPNFDITVVRPTDATQALWTYGVRSGDSGQPILLMLGGQAILLTLWNGGAFTGGWIGAGPDYSQNISAINTAMHSLSVAHSAPNDYQVTTADLSAYSSY